MLHSYDLFQVWKEPGVSDADVASSLKATFGIEVAGFESTLGVFMANLGTLSRHVTVHQGDITKMTWPGRPVELLFIDICKMEAVWKHMVAMFYRSLIPGHSIVIHQDWHHAMLPYIHIGQEAFAEYFEVVVRKADDSAAFRLVRRIPDRVIDDVALHGLPEEQQLALMDRVIARFEGESRFLRLSKAMLLMQIGRRDDASQLLHETSVNAGEAMTHEERRYFEGSLGAVTRAIEGPGLSKPEGWDESAYLAANDDAREAVERGVFESGLVHWSRHGRWMGRPLR